MAQFRTLKILDDTIGLRRISREQTVSGFDLFTDADVPAREIPQLRLAVPSPDHPAICARAFSYTARPSGETPEGLLFSDGITLGEFCEKIQGTSSESPLSGMALAPYLSAFHSIWLLLKRIESSGFTLHEIRPHEILRQETASDAEWRILPTPNVVPYHGQETCRRKFMHWIHKFPFPLPLSMKVLLHFAESSQWNAWQNAALENGDLWTPNVPSVPFHSLKSDRKGTQLTLSWGKEEISSNSETLHLFEMQPGKRFPQNTPLLPKDALTEFCGKEFPISSGMNSVQLTLNGPQPLRLCGIRILGSWARPGRIFRVGGPEDVTFFDIYRDEESLVLDLDWPDQIDRAQIIASPKEFPAGPQLEPDSDAEIRVWFHDRFNPLIPKRIPLAEFTDWEQVFLRVFSLAENEGKPIFSLGQDPQSRRKFLLRHE
ncbi:MAG: hypothetical protein J6J31_14890 [Thermoguttaceae bacterium]|nr:hypothetical protein [Thermoguttaceae bacterium]